MLHDIILKKMVAYMDVKSLIFGFLLGVILIFILLAITVYIINKRFLKSNIKAPQIDNQEFYGTVILLKFDQSN